MTEQKNQARFSLEELVVCLSMMGKPEAAKMMLVAFLGPINEDEESGRLLAAKHSLLAKEILYLERENVRLHDTYARLLSPLAYSDAALRCSRKTPGQLEILLSHYVRNHSLIRHRVDYGGAVHTLTEITSEEEVVKGCLDFLQIDSQSSFFAPPARLTRQQLEDVRNLATDSVQEALHYLQKFGVPEDTSRLFARDLNENNYRGSVLRLETIEGEPESDAGFLTLKGVSGRTWFLEIFLEEDTVYVRLAPADMDTLQKAILELFERN